MDDATYTTWLQLHRRIENDEMLTLEEWATYEAGLRQLYAKEVYCDNYAEEVRAAEALIAELLRERTRLQEERRELEARAAALEAARTARAKQRISAGDR